MKIVIDTNVVISGTFFGEAPGAIIGHLSGVISWKVPFSR